MMMAGMVALHDIVVQGVVDNGNEHFQTFSVDWSMWGVKKSLFVVVWIPKLTILAMMCTIWVLDLTRVGVMGVIWMFMLVIGIGSICHLPPVGQCHETFHVCGLAWSMQRPGLCPSASHFSCSLYSPNLIPCLIPSCRLSSHFSCIFLVPYFFPFVQPSAISSLHSSSFVLSNNSCSSLCKYICASSDCSVRVTCDMVSVLAVVASVDASAVLLVGFLLVSVELGGFSGICIPYAINIYVFGNNLIIVDTCTCKSPAGNHHLLTHKYN